MAENVPPPDALGSRVDRDTPDAAHAAQHDRQPPEGKGPHQTGGEDTPGGKLIQKSGGLSEPFIRRPVMTVLLSVAIIAFGALTYKLLSVNDLPAVDYPVINVSCSYPGASPETMANNIATPLEKQFLLINGLTLVTSASTQSNTSLTLQFDLSKTLSDAATDVQAAIQRATGQLPTDLPSPPTFTKTNPNDQAILLLGLVTDTMTDADLYKYANNVVAQQISILPGVSQVQVYGVKGAIRIKADPAALVNRGMTMDDLAAGIKAGTAYSGAGQFDGAHRTFVLQPNGQVDTVGGYLNMIVGRNKDSSPIFLKDVAAAYNGLQDERMSRFFWVRELAEHPPGSTVVLAVSRQAGSNAVEVARTVTKLLPTLRAGLPGSIRLLPVYDRSQTIVDSVNDVQTTLFIAFVLVVGVIFAFLGRAADTLIPAVALPLSLLLTFVAMYLLNYSVNNLTLMALTLAIGFLVDDAVVFLENVVRRAEAGETVLPGDDQQRGRDFLHDPVDDPVAGGGVHPAGVPAEPAGTDLPGVLADDHRGDLRLRVGVADAHAADVRAGAEPNAGRAASRKRGWSGKVGDFPGVGRGPGYGRSLDWFLNYSWMTALHVRRRVVVGVFVFWKTCCRSACCRPGTAGFIRGVFIAQEGSLRPTRCARYQAKVNEVLKKNPNVSEVFHARRVERGARRVRRG